MVLCFHGGSVAAGDADLDRIKDGFNQWRSTIQSLDIKYTLLNQRNSEFVKRTTHVFRGLRNLRYSFNEHETPGMPVSLDENLHESVYDGASLVVMNHPNRQAAIRRKTAKTSSSDYQMPAYVRAIGWWPVEAVDSPPDNGGCFVAPHIQFASIPPSSIDVNCVDSRFYIVRFAGKESIWFDKIHDFAICRREQPTLDGKFNDVIELANFKKVDGAWLPFEYRRRIESTRPGVGVTGITTAGTLVSASVGKLTLNDFSLTIPPGTLVVNTDTEEFAQVPGGIEQMDFIVDFSMRLNSAIERRIVSEGGSSSPSRDGSTWSLICYCILVVNCAFILFAIVFLRGKRRRADD